MSIRFHKTLSETLKKIKLQKYHRLLVHELETVRTIKTSDEVIDHYGKAKWKIVDLLNEHYPKKLKTPFDLYNWLHKKKDDEVSYFLSEAGSNCLNYATFKAPSQFHLWLGEKGFVIGIEQKGNSFPARTINEEKIKDHGGAAFTFFRNCKSSIFFNHPDKATIVYMECLIDDVQN